MPVQVCTICKHEEETRHWKESESLRQTWRNASLWLQITADLHEQVCFVQVFMVIPPWLSYPCNFINGTDSKLWTGANDLFRGTAYSVMSHSLHTIYTIQIYFFPITLWPPIVCYRLLFTHQAMCNRIWHLKMCACCLLRCRTKLNQ